MRQKDHRANKLLRLSNPPEWGSLEEPGEPAGILARALRHRGLDDSGCDRVNADPVQCELAGESLGKQLHGSFDGE